MLFDLYQWRNESNDAEQMPSGQEGLQGEVKSQNSGYHHMMKVPPFKKHVTYLQLPYFFYFPFYDYDSALQSPYSKYVIMQTVSVPCSCSSTIGMKWGIFY